MLTACRAVWESAATHPTVYTGIKKMAGLPNRYFLTSLIRFNNIQSSIACLLFNTPLPQTPNLILACIPFTPSRQSILV